MESQTRKRIAIVTVPYITSPKHAKFAQISLESFRSSKHEIVNIGVVNRLEPRFKDKILPYYDHVIYNDRNVLARAWNIGISYAIEQGFDYILLPNLDVISRRDTIDKLVKVAQEMPEAMIWAATSHPEQTTIHNCKPEKWYSFNYQRDSFSYYMIDKRLFKQIGKFDERYVPAYYEDWDMRDRVHASGNYMIRANHVRFYHFGAQTRRNDNNIARILSKQYPLSAKLYESKRRKLLQAIDFTKGKG